MELYCFLLEIQTLQVQLSKVNLFQIRRREVIFGTAWHGLFPIRRRRLFTSAYRSTAAALSYGCLDHGHEGPERFDGGPKVTLTNV